MTIQETSHESFAHPYRGEPCTLDDDGLRVPYTGQSRMRLSLSSGLSQGRIVIDPAAHDLIAIRCGDGPLPRVRVASGEIGDDGMVDVDAERLDTRGQQVAGGDGVQGRRQHERD